MNPLQLLAVTILAVALGDHPAVRERRQRGLLEHPDLAMSGEASRLEITCSRACGPHFGGGLK